MAAFFGLLAFIFGVLALLFGVLLGVGITYYLQAKKDLESAEIEKERIGQQAKRDLTRCQEVAKESNTRVQQQAKKDLARYQTISDLEKYKADLDAKIRSAHAMLPKLQKLAEMEQHWEQLTRTLYTLNTTVTERQQQVATHDKNLTALVAQTQAVEETLVMQSFGFYKPKYGFDSSENYTHKLGTIREAQESLVKTDHATECPQEWTVDGSAAKGREMVKKQAKLMLRAFNGECDAAIAKVKYNNVTSLESRINRSFDAVNKLGEANKIWITREYLNLKLQELFLVHEHREKVEAEREEQREIRERMREEEKVEKEIEKAKKDAEREEQTKGEALERARQELATSQGVQTGRLQAIVDKLELELKDALERKAKAIARAQLTRSGWVYVLSNIGSFGKNVYKIGMTRRFDPSERVDELSQAAVPFRFDVHAMIFTEDAPSLENTLHKHFDHRRVNMVNLRREFFHVTLDEIREAIKKHHGTITFVIDPEAEEYQKTVSMRGSVASPTGNPQLALAV